MRNYTVEMPAAKLAEIETLLNTMLALGATHSEANSALVEVYSPPRVTAVAKKFPRYGVLPGGAFDLRPDSSGTSWDFSREEDRREATV